MPYKRHELGILFVHGIGDQQQGSTLLQFGEPVIETLRRWHMGQTGKGADVVRVIESVLLPARNFSTDPAHSVVEFEVDGESRRWLLAEDWWGDQVVQPDPREFVTWMLTRGSWIVLLHLVERLIDHPKRNWQSRLFWLWLNSPLTPPNVRTALNLATVHRPRLVDGVRAIYGRWWILMIWTAIALAIQIPLLAAFVIALVPIPSVSKWVASLVRRLASVLGDSFVLVKRESQRGAILTHFEQSLAYVASKSRYVAIVAHSQGTAVACEVLRLNPGLRPDLLVTFGSGVAKLDQLYLAESSRRLSLTLAGFGPVIGAAALVLLLPTTPWPFAVRLILATVAGIGWSLLATYVLWHIVESRSDLHEHYARPGGAQLADVWADYNATHDPVPTATLQQTFGMSAKRLRSETIANRKSFIWDHTTYLGNFAEFVLPLCRRLSAFGGLQEPLPENGVADTALRMHYGRMVTLYQWSYWLTLSIVPLLAWLEPDVFERWGATLRTAPPWGFLPEWMRSLGEWSWSQVPSWLPFDTRLSAIASAVALATAGTLVYRPVFGEIWEWWNLQAMESSVQHGRLLAGWRSASQLLWLGIVAALPTLALILAIWFAR